MRIRFCCSVITNENRRLLLTLNVLYLLNLQVTCFHICVNKIFKQIIWWFRRHYVVNMSKYSLTGPLNNKRTHLFLLVSICFFTLLDYTKVRFWLYLTAYLEWYIQLDIQLNYNSCIHSSKKHSPIFPHFRVYKTKRSLNFHPNCPSISEPGAHF